MRSGSMFGLLFLMLLAKALAAGPEEAFAPPKFFPPPVSTADHAKFESLKKDFRSPQEVTKACLSCHNQAGEHFLKTLHWTWTWKGKDGRLLGKGHVINNY